MLTTKYKLNPITNSLKVVFPAIFYLSINVAASAATDIGSEGININHDAHDSAYNIASSTAIDANSSTAPIIVNDDIVSSLTNDGEINNSVGSSVVIQDFAGEIVNNNIISAKEYGLDAQGGRTLNITNNGTIEGEQAAIHVSSNASITNSGTLGDASTRYGILIDSGSTTIMNNGAINGSEASILFNTDKNQLILKDGSILNADVITAVQGNSITLMESGTEDSNFIGKNSGDGFSKLEMRGNEWTLDGNIDLVNSDSEPSLKVTNGTLTLNGTVNNNGDSFINKDASLQLGNGAKTAEFNATDITNNGTLVFNQGSDSLFATNINGAGDVIKNDNNTLTLSGTNDYTGTTALNAGSTLVTGALSSPEIQINSSALLATQGMITGNVAIGQGGTLAAWESVEGTTGASSNTIIGNVSNAGELRLSAINNVPGTQFTIEGDYHGDEGSRVTMNTQAGNDSSPTDHLSITKDSSGSSAITVTNAGGAGAETINGIELISVGGVSDATFNLAKPVTAGKWEYNLTKKDNNWYLVSEKPSDDGGTGGNDDGGTGGNDNGGTGGNDDGGTGGNDNGGNGGNDNGGTGGNDNGGTGGNDNGGTGGNDNGGTGGNDNGGTGGNDNGGTGGNDNNWNPPEILNPETSAYLGNYMAAQQMFIHKRDDREQLLARGDQQNNGWMYVRGRHNDANIEKGRGSYDTTTTVFQLGSDLISRRVESGEWHAGFMLGTGLSETHAKAAHNSRHAKGHVSGYNVGLYGTWQEDPLLRTGGYVDTWISASWYDSWVKGDKLEREKYSSKGFAASLETGYAWLLPSQSSRHWKIEPQGQVVFSYLDQNKHTERNGNRISDVDNNSYFTRLGVRLSNMDTAAPGAWQPWIAANWLNGAGMNDLKFNGEKAKDNTPENRGQLEIGINGDLNKSMNISIRAFGERGEKNYKAWGGQVLWNYRW